MLQNNETANQDVATPAARWWRYCGLIFLSHSCCIFYWSVRAEAEKWKTMALQSRIARRQTRRNTSAIDLMYVCIAYNASRGGAHQSAIPRSNFKSASAIWPNLRPICDMITPILLFQTAQNLRIDACTSNIDKSAAWNMCGRASASFSMRSPIRGSHNIARWDWGCEQMWSYPTFQFWLEVSLFTGWTRSFNPTNQPLELLWSSKSDNNCSSFA